MAGLKSSNNFMVCTFVALGLLNVTIISCESNSASDEIRIAQPSVGLLPVAVGHLQKSSSRQGIRCDRTGNRPKLVEENDDFDIVGNVPDMYNVRAVARTDASKSRYILIRKVFKIDARLLKLRPQQVCLTSGNLLFPIDSAFDFSEGYVYLTCGYTGREYGVTVKRTAQKSNNFNDNNNISMRGLPG